MRNFLIITFILVVVLTIVIPLPCQAIEPLWIFKTGKDRPVLDIAMSSDGMKIFAADGTLYTIEREGALSMSGFNVKSLAIPSDDSFLAIGGATNLCRLTLKGMTTWCNSDILGGVYRIFVTNNGSNIIAASGIGGRIFYFDEYGSILWNAYGGTDLYDVAIPPDGSFVVVTGSNDHFQSFDKSGNIRFIRSRDRSNGIQSHDIAISGNGLYIVAGEDIANWGAIQLFDRWANSLWKFLTDGWLRRVAISENGSYIAGGDWKIGPKRDGEIYFLNITGSLLWRHNTMGYITALRMTPDGAYIAAGTADGKIYFFDSGGSLLWTKQLEGEVTSLYLSPNASDLVAGTKNGYISFFSKTTEPSVINAGGGYLDPWWDENITDARSWEYRIPIQVKEQKGQTRLETSVVLTLSSVFGANVSQSGINFPAVRIVDPQGSPDSLHETGGNDVDYQIDDRTNDQKFSDEDYLIFKSNVSAYEKKTFYAYFSYNPEISPKRYLPKVFNNLADPSFEQSENATLSKWKTSVNGVLAPSNPIDHGRLNLTSENLSESVAVFQFINLSPSEWLEYVQFGGWSKTSDLSEPADKNFSVYINMYYEDGSATYGLAFNGTPAPFRTGTHDWEFSGATAIPNSALKEISIHIILKNHTGTAWIDDVELIKGFYQIHVGERQWKYTYSGPPITLPGTPTPSMNTPPPPATSATGGFILPVTFLALIAIAGILGFMKGKK